MASAKTCNASCRRAVVLPPARCKCVCEGWNHGKEPRLPGFTAKEMRNGVDTNNEPQDVKQDEKEIVTEDARDAKSDPPLLTHQPTQVYRGIRHLAADACLYINLGAANDHAF